MDSQELVKKLDNLARTDWKEMTVSELAARLAGLPPMMDVYADADGTAMYLNNVEVQQAEGYSPFLRLICNRYPKPQEVSDKTYAEQLADMRQRAMHLARQGEDESRMQRAIVE